MHPTPHLEVLQIVAGEFHRKSRYYSWRPKGTHDWLFIYTLAGGGRYEDEKGLTYGVEEGDCTLYEPGAWQHYMTDPGRGNWSLLWAHFQPLPHWRPHLSWPEKWKGFRTVSLNGKNCREKVVKGMRTAVQSCRSGLPLAGDLGLNALERVLLEVENERRGHPLGASDERILRAVEHLSLRFQEPFSVGGLARKCGLSVSRFAHLFKSQTGSTPQQMLEENRMRFAAGMLLSTGLSIAEIAGEAGYTEPFYFTHRFRLFFGKSPRDFRSATTKRRSGTRSK